MKNENSTVGFGYEKIVNYIRIYGRLKYGRSYFMNEIYTNIINGYYC